MFLTYHLPAGPLPINGQRSCIVADPEHGGCWHTRVRIRAGPRHLMLLDLVIQDPHSPQTSKKNFIRI